MEPVVDDGFAARAFMVVGNGRSDRRAAMLGREWDDGGRSAKRRGDRTAVEVIGGHDAHPGELLDMAVAVHATGKHITAPGVNIARTCRKMIRDGDDLLADDADVATCRLGCGRHGAIADGEVELVHL